VKQVAIVVCVGGLFWFMRGLVQGLRRGMADTTPPRCACRDWQCQAGDLVVSMDAQGRARTGHTQRVCAPIEEMIV
jgi:hypothetical protein